jgi:uncharacterized protein YodC (DUF2158 family)
MAKFKEGDVVELKSGGPPMTIDEVIVDGLQEIMYKCQWFTAQKHLKHKTFHENQLRRYIKPKGRRP